MALLRYAALCAAVTLCACQRAPTDIDAREYIVVHSVLVANSDTVTVFVSRTADSSLDRFRVIRPIPDAEVALVHGADTVRLTSTRACHESPTVAPGQAASSDGCYAAVIPGRVRAGDTYDLIVNVSGAPTIRGTTRVPAVRQLSGVQPGAELFVNTVYNPSQPPTAVSLHWSADGAGRQADVRIVPDRADCFVPIARPDEDAGTDAIEIIAGDTATVNPTTISCGQQLTQRYAASVVVTVYDPNYSEYLRRHARGLSVGADVASQGLTGALGVFGAAASAGIPVVLVAR